MFLYFLKEGPINRLKFLSKSYRIYWKKGGEKARFVFQPELSPTRNLPRSIGAGAVCTEVAYCASRKENEKNILTQS